MNQPHSARKQSFDDFRDRLAFQDAVPQLVVLGLVSGLAASLLIVAFRLLIETPLALTFAGEVDAYEKLSLTWRFLLPFLAAAILGIVMHFVAPQNRAVSVSHVLDRLHNFQGKIPGRNMLLQFFGGALALASGQSVGREGPGVHLGAGVASLIGQWLRLPNNSLRTLVACGAAAAIAASFNTPMAGVVFAMEVILMEYTITGFIPVIIASVLGATISRLVFGTDINFVPMSGDENLVAEIPFMVLAGLVFALAAAAFIRLHLFCLARQRWPVWLRYLIIGLCTGLVAMAVPDIMGTGYDTLNAAMVGSLDLRLLLLVMVAKLTVTAVATGLGMVGGLIGPTLVMGGCLGGALALLAQPFLPLNSPPEFYVIVGMVAMMGAVLNAPLAALVAILELSHSPQIIFPSMITVVVACLGVQLGFRYRGIFTEQLKLAGLDVEADPGKGFLSRVGVGAVMNRSFRLSGQTITLARAGELVSEQALWLVVERERDYRLMAMADLARHLDSLSAANTAAPENGVPGKDAEEASVAEPGFSAETLDEDMEIALDGIPSPTLDLALIDSLASLHEASREIRLHGAEALLVIESIPYSESRVVGVISRETFMNYYGM